MLSAHARRPKSSDAVSRRLCVCAGRWRSGSPSRCCSCVWVRRRYLPGGLGGRRALRAAPWARDGDWEEAGPGPRRRAGFAPSSPFVPRALPSCRVPAGPAVRAGPLTFPFLAKPDHLSAAQLSLKAWDLWLLPRSQVGFRHLHSPLGERRHPSPAALSKLGVLLTCSALPTSPGPFLARA